MEVLEEIASKIEVIFSPLKMQPFYSPHNLQQNPHIRLRKISLTAFSTTHGGIFLNLHLTMNTVAAQNVVIPAKTRHHFALVFH